MSRYMNYDSTSIPKGKSVGDIVHEMTLYAKRDPEPYVRWAGEVIELKQRLRELESLLRQALDVLEHYQGNYKLGRHTAQYVLDLTIALRKQLKEPPR